MSNEESTQTPASESSPPTSRFSPQVESVLRQAGWYPGRTVPESLLEQWMVVELYTEPGYHYQVRMFSAAYHILREFGGLVIEQDEPGVTCSRNPFVFDPLKAASEIHSYNWPFAEWEADGSLFPIGFYGKGTTADHALTVYGRGRIADEDYEVLYGRTIDEALERLIVGLMPPPLETEVWKAREASEVFPLMRNRLGLK